MPLRNTLLKASSFLRLKLLVTLDPLIWKVFSSLCIQHRFTNLVTFGSSAIFIKVLNQPTQKSSGSIYRGVEFLLSKPNVVVDPFNRIDFWQPRFILCLVHYEFLQFSWCSIDPVSCYWMSQTTCCPIAFSCDCSFTRVCSLKSAHTSSLQIHLFKFRYRISKCNITYYFERID